MMKFLMLMSFSLPLLTSCHIDSEFLEPSIPGVVIEQPNVHQHGSRLEYGRNDLYNQNKVYRRRPRAGVIVEPARNTHGHESREEIIVPAQKKVRRHRPGVQSLEQNRHGHTNQPKVRVEEQNYVHGHD